MLPNPRPMKRRDFSFLTLASLCTVSRAQDPTAKPVRVVVPFPPGGGTDVVSRLFAQQLASLWKQSIVTDNKPGANTIIGSEFVAKSAPDGLTWLVASPSHTINASLYAKTIPYQTERDFRAVAMLASGPLGLFAHPSVSARNVKELIELARSKPGSIRYGSAGTGSSPHLAGAMYAKMAGVEMVHVPYKGTAPSIADLLGGHIDITFTPLPGMQQHLESGRLRALAVTTSKRFSAVPSMPTIGESGLPGYDISQWWGVVVPKSTPQAMVDRIHGGIREVQKRPDVQQSLLGLGAEVRALSPTELDLHIQTEIIQYRKLIESAQITPD